MPAPTRTGPFEPQHGADGRYTVSRAYFRTHSSSLSGSALTVGRTAWLSGGSAVLALLNMISAARTWVAVMSATPSACCFR
jgi:hypothetical protein